MVNSFRPCRAPRSPQCKDVAMHGPPLGQGRFDAPKCRKRFELLGGASSLHMGGQGAGSTLLSANARTYIARVALELRLRNLFRHLSAYSSNSGSANR